MKIDIRNGIWHNPPKGFKTGLDKVNIRTDPHTDFWQRSYYGFRNANAPAYLFETTENFTFSCRCSFDYTTRFDQAGIIIFLDDENWFKASIEYEDRVVNRLGSVCTNFGYSDWATTDISPIQKVWYRLSRRGPDFLVESSEDGQHYTQMRIFHLHQLGDTSLEMAAANPPNDTLNSVKFGVYACSPGESSFDADFDQLTYGPSLWQAHK